MLYNDCSVSHRVNPNLEKSRTHADFGILWTSYDLHFPVTQAVFYTPKIEYNDDDVMMMMMMMMMIMMMMMMMSCKKVVSLFFTQNELRAKKNWELV